MHTTVRGSYKLLTTWISPTSFPGVVHAHQKGEQIGDTGADIQRQAVQGTRWEEELDTGVAAACRYRGFMFVGRTTTTITCTVFRGKYPPAAPPTAAAPAALLS